MDTKKLIKKINRNTGFDKIKTQIRTINLSFAFFVVVAGFAIYLNHNGLMISYGLTVAGVSFLVIAMLLSYRLKLQVRLSNMKLDYRNYVVKPYAEEYFENGSFSKNGSLTEREVVSTLMFSDTRDFVYTTSNELKGIYKGVRFTNSDVYEDNKTQNIHIYGRIFMFDMSTPNINPVVFTTSTAPVLEYQHDRVHLVKTKNEVANRMFRIYAFDENEADSILTDNLVYKLREIVGQQLGKINKICFYDGKIYVYFTTTGSTYEEDLTKKHDIEKELEKIRKAFDVVGKLIDIL